MRVQADRDQRRGEAAEQQDHERRREDREREMHVAQHQPGNGGPSPSSWPPLSRISRRAMCPQMIAPRLPSTGSTTQQAMPNTRLAMASGLLGSVDAGGGGRRSSRQRSNLMPCASGSASE